jgi:hypothetical protein
LGILTVGSGQQYSSIAAAVAASQDGDVLQVKAGTYTNDFATISHKITIEGIGGQVNLVATAQPPNGKAILVVNNDLTLDNISFSGTTVRDGNGAGIRAEGRGLTVEGSRFLDNEDGILTTDKAGTVAVRDSEFRGNGTCRLACAHGIYAGHVDALVVERSRFSGTHEGHHVKSRARTTTVAGCMMEEGTDGAASYLIDVPNGGAVLIAGNRMSKGPRSSNPSTAISIGAEGATNPTPSIVVRDNWFVNRQPVPTVFVRNLTGTPAVLQDNRLEGAVVPLAELAPR